MDVRFSTEQRQLRAAAARLVDDLGPHTVGQLGDTGRVARLDAAVSATGWRELRSATGDGTPLASGVETAIVAEELGRATADVSYVGPVLAGELRRLAGAPPATDPETVVLRADLSAVACGDRDRNPPMVAVDVAGSSRALLVVTGPDGPQLAGVALGSAPTGVDLTRPSMALDPRSEVTAIGSGDGTLSVGDLTRWTALGLSLTCADLVGTMRGAVRLGVAYATERHQYGAAIGSFQAVQHLLADAFVHTEGASSISLHAAWAVDQLAADDALAAAAMAKAYCARAAREVCETVIQVHGGIGNTWECSAHLFLRRALLSIDLLGGVGPNLARVLAHHGIGGDDGLR